MIVGASESNFCVDCEFGIENQIVKMVKIVKIVNIVKIVKMVKISKPPITLLREREKFLKEKRQSALQYRASL